MYFNEGAGYFAISDDMKELLFDWQVGPLYGRGYIYSIINNDLNKLELFEDRLIWVS
jgi:hypothetical protein